MKAWQILLIGILFGLLAAGLILLVSRPPVGEKIRLDPSPTLSPITVSVSGNVRRPGLYTLSQGSRIQAAVEAAGGFTEKAHPQGLNLAAVLSDGQQVVIPAIGENPVSSTENGTALGPDSPASGLTTLAQPLDINTASRQELELLPGIGAEKANQILIYREEHGPFLSIDEIQLVPGIGPGLFEKMKDLIAVSP